MVTKKMYKQISSVHGSSVLIVKCVFPLFSYSQVKGNCDSPCSKIKRGDIWQTFQKIIIPIKSCLNSINIWPTVPSTKVEWMLYKWWKQKESCAEGIGNGSNIVPILWENCCEFVVSMGLLYNIVFLCNIVFLYNIVQLMAKTALMPFNIFKNNVNFELM